MSDLMTREGIEWIIESILKRAEKLVQKKDETNTDFYKGVMHGYYEVLDIIKSRIIIREGDPEEYDLGFTLEELEKEIERRLKEK